MNDIVVVGSLNMDVYIKTPRTPELGETIAGHDLCFIPGGKGSNQAAAAARLGGKVHMVGRVGTDPFGAEMRQNLVQLGVDVSYLQIDSDASSGVAIVIIEQSGDNRIIIAPGSNGCVDPADIDAAEPILRQAGIMLVQFEIPLATVERALDLARRWHVPALLNPAPAYQVPPSFLNKADYLVLNETEARILTGIEVGDLASARAAAEALQSTGVRTVVLTLGERGALLASPQGAVHVPAQRVPVVDTTAAGDAFVGGMAVSLVGGRCLPDAVRYATAAGTLTVTRFGSQTALPSCAEVQAFLVREPGANPA